jgi:Vacuolar protein sorting-associated protein 26
MSYFFSTPVDIDIVLEDTDERAMVDVKLDKNRKEKVPLYMDGESVKGAVTIRPKDGKRLEHTGIKVQFIGTIGEFAQTQAYRSRIRLFPPFGNLEWLLIYAFSYPRDVF